MSFKNNTLVKLDCGCMINWPDGGNLYQGAYFCCPEHDNTYVLEILDDIMVFSIKDENQIGNAKILHETKEAVLMNLFEEGENDGSWNRYWFPLSQINLTRDEVRIPMWIWEGRRKA